MKAHPLAGLFPLMEGQPFLDLCEDIRKHGLLHPIVRLNDLILDGRNRQRGCDATGRAPRYVEFASLGLSCTPEEYIWSSNIARRDLTPDQRAMIALAWKAQLEKDGLRAMVEGGKKGGKKAGKGRPNRGMAKSPYPYEAKPTSRRKLADQAQVSQYKIRQAEAVQKTDPEAAEQVKAGTLTIKEAEKRTGQKPKKQARAKKEKAFDLSLEVAGIVGRIRDKILAVPQPFRSDFIAELRSVLKGIWDAYS